MATLPFEDDDSTAEIWQLNANFYRQLKQALEDFFSARWFQTTSDKSHPAYRYWKLCQRLLSQGGVIHVSEQRADLPLLARLGLDATNFIDLTQGNLPLLQLGALQHLGSSAVIQRIQERIVDVQYFEDMMTELYMAAWYGGKIFQGKNTKRHFKRSVHIAGLTSWCNTLH